MFNYEKPIYYDTLRPYYVIDHKGIQYLVCRDFDHICRYKGLRQLAHCPNDTKDRFIALETPNGFTAFTKDEISAATENEDLDLTTMYGLNEKLYHNRTYSTSSDNFDWYEVPAVEENRLDLIAYRFLGSAQYAWILAYINNIEDGYTVLEGQKIKVLKNITYLFEKDGLLAEIPAMQLNLGEE